MRSSGAPRPSSASSRLNIFLAVVLRKFFARQIPDSYDFGKMLLGTLIFWGIAATSYRGSHITVDLLWSAASPSVEAARSTSSRRSVLLFVVAVQTIMLFDKVRATFVDHVLTYDLNIPTWPFYAVAWLGDVSAVVLIAIRTYRLVLHPEQIVEDVVREGRTSEQRLRSPSSASSRCSC